MGDILLRRRMLVPSGVSCPYITDGLIFWLDGMNRGGVTGQWKDLVGGKIFTLNNVTEGETGVYFDGTVTSYGVFAGTISSNYSTETLEMATSNATYTNKCLFCQPFVNDSVGICLVFSSSGSLFNLNMDGVKTKMGYGLTKMTRFSANTSYFVENGEQKTWHTNKDYWGKNTSGNTYLAIRSSGTNLQKAFAGTIYCVRIYNRQLSVAEMQANQAVDAARFNL